MLPVMSYGEMSLNICFHSLIKGLFRSIGYSIRTKTITEEIGRTALFVTVYERMLLKGKSFVDITERHL